VRLFEIASDMAVLCVCCSWHLMTTLCSLHYNHLSTVHHTSVCLSYASQLESCGLWHWAVFVLLHLYEPHR